MSAFESPSLHWYDRPDIMSLIAIALLIGYTVMSRMSLLIGRFRDLQTYAGGEYAYATAVLLSATIVTLALWEILGRRGTRLE